MRIAYLVPRHSSRATRHFFLAIAVTVLTGGALGQLDYTPPSPLNGVWRNVDTGESVTIIIERGFVVIETSNGGFGRGAFDGEKIEYSGMVQTPQGKVKTQGTYEMGTDDNSMVKRRQVYYPEGTAEEATNYVRASSSKPAQSPTPRPRSTPAPTPSATPVPSSPFVGVWRPADDSAGLTITVSGRGAVLRYSSGSRDTGTIRGNKIECETVSQSDGLKSTDLFELSASGKTLIRRRTLESPRGETGHETLTYSRGE